MKYLLLRFLLTFCCIASAQDKFTVYFDFDIDEVNDASAASLDEWLKQHKDADVLKIYGYADAAGDGAYNRDLSERRAAYVYGRVKLAGLKVDNIEEQSFGESRASSADRAKDRKVEIYYNRSQPVAVPAPIPTPEPKLTESVAGAKKGDKLRLANLNFHNNSNVVLPESQPVMKELLKIMQDNPNLKIDIQGHICCMNIDVNDIAVKRAKAVYNYLKLNNVAGGRISYQGFGSSRPIYKLPETNEEQRIANRRVEIEILEN